MSKLLPAALLLAFAASCAAVPAATAAPESAKSRAAASRLAKIAHNAKVRQVLVVRSGRHGLRYVSAIRVEPAKPSFGQMIGLHESADSLELKSGVALVLDQDTNEILFSKNSQAILPIASLTKLMTAMVVTAAHQPLDETITITDEDIDTEKGSRSRLRVGTQLRREDMLHLALMSSENRAANALGRNYPGGLGAFVAAMNQKARQLGMNDTHYVEPTGLSSGNQSSARDLATLVGAAHEVQLIRELSTSPEYMVEVGNRAVQFRNTNGLVKSPEWDIGLQKTGYISEAGRCLVMQAKMAGRHLIMVFLDSAGKYSRIGDAERVRRWVTASVPGVVPAALEAHKPPL
ncbi:MAG: D-alanyl-D-alanine endopeptidase [Pseudomonadota bacterium]|nr:D-alanyl-D-alanine endopeptidase [Pseudomonadota bacterium]